ncbi:unnamed protein product [Somion occarium]|uniref:4'-phosphopantetheinyl transferase domain-containing protein n=1 Tax=Somion occarium TaxID=3059160 RepID=A0ABP1D6L5_9APHY
MAILGVGIDLVSIRRIVDLVRRRSAARLAHRILSSSELSGWQSRPFASSDERIKFLAVRWAVKEAAYKALYPTFRPTWKELTYESFNRATTQKPSLVYRAIKDSTFTLHVSVSHDGDYVVAQVLADSG